MIKERISIDEKRTPLIKPNIKERASAATAHIMGILIFSFNR